MIEPMDIGSVDPTSVRYELLAYGYNDEEIERLESELHEDTLRWALHAGALDDPAVVKDALAMLKKSRVQAGAELAFHLRNLKADLLDMFSDLLDRITRVFKNSR